jgi:hypothetical protein
MATETEEDLLLKSFMSEVGEVERDNEVKRSINPSSSLPL